MDPSRLSRDSFTCKYDFAFLGYRTSNGSGAKRGKFAILQILAQIGVLEPSADCKKVSGVVPKQVPGGSGWFRKFFRKLPGASGRFQVVPGDSGRFREVPGGSGRFRVVPGVPGWFREIPGGSGSFRAVPGRSGSFREIPGDSGSHFGSDWRQERI